MSTTGKRKAPREKDIHRPLPRKTLAFARSIAARYQMKLWCEDGEWYGQGVEEPGIYADGRTMSQCARNLREALAIGVAWNIEDGLPVAEPISEKEQGRGRKAG